MLSLSASARYRIRARGFLDSSWSSDLSDLVIVSASAPDVGETVTLTGVLTDQAALLGVLLRLNQLGFPILSVEHLGPDGEPT